MPANPFGRWMDMVDRRLHVLENKKPKPADGTVPSFEARGFFGSGDGGDGGMFTVEEVWGDAEIGTTFFGVSPTIRGLWQVTFGVRAWSEFTLYYHGWSTTMDHTLSNFYSDYQVVNMVNGQQFQWTMTLAVGGPGERIHATGGAGADGETTIVGHYIRDTTFSGG